MTKKQYRQKINEILEGYLRADEYTSIMVELDELDELDKASNPDLAVEELLHGVKNIDEWKTR